MVEAKVIEVKKKTYPTYKYEEGYEGFSSKKGVNVSDGLYKGYLGGYENRVNEFEGVAVANKVNDMNTQRGIAIARTNRAGKLRGVQCGLLNICGDDSKGLQLGLINYKQGDDRWYNRLGLLATPRGLIGSIKRFIRAYSGKKHKQNNPQEGNGRVIYIGRDGRELEQRVIKEEGLDEERPNIEPESKREIKLSEDDQSMLLLQRERQETISYLREIEKNCRGIPKEDSDYYNLYNQHKKKKVEIENKITSLKKEVMQRETKEKAEQEKQKEENRPNDYKEGFERSSEIMEELISRHNREIPWDSEDNVKYQLARHDRIQLNLAANKMGIDLYLKYYAKPGLKGYEANEELNLLSEQTLAVQRRISENKRKKEELMMDKRKLEEEFRKAKKKKRKTLREQLKNVYQEIEVLRRVEGNFRAEKDYIDYEQERLRNAVQEIAERQERNAPYPRKEPESKPLEREGLSEGDGDRDGEEARLKQEYNVLVKRLEENKARSKAEPEDAARPKKVTILPEHISRLRKIYMDLNTRIETILENFTFKEDDSNYREWMNIILEQSRIKEQLENEGYQI